MNIILIVLLHLMLHSPPLERAETALDLLNKAFPDWTENYQEGEFDCSEMSSFVRDYLAVWGVETDLKCGGRWENGKVIGHTWLVLGDKAIECTTLKFQSLDYYKKYERVHYMGILETELDWWNVDYITGVDKERGNGNDTQYNDLPAAGQFGAVEGRDRK